MPLGNDQHQFLPCDGDKFHGRLIFHHRAECNVVFAFLQLGDQIRRKPGGIKEAEINLPVRVRVQITPDDIRHEIRTQGTEDADVDQAFPASGHLQAADAGIQNIQRLLYIF